MEVKELLAPLSLERVRFPPCSPALAAALASGRAALSLEEITAVEELLNAQCRVRVLPEDLDSLMQDAARARRGQKPDSEGPANRPEDEAHQRDAIRNAVLEVRTTAEPLDHWVRNNGDFVFPEEQLEFFDRLVGQDSCRMPDQEVDLSYRTLRSLEELARIEEENEPQRVRLERFLSGVHIVIDRKIKEFFR